MWRKIHWNVFLPVEIPCFETLYFSRKEIDQQCPLGIAVFFRSSCYRSLYSFLVFDENVFFVDGVFKFL